jgi:hypothetical protein
MPPIYPSGSFEALAKIFVNSLAGGRRAKTPPKIVKKIHSLQSFFDSAEICKHVGDQKIKLLSTNFVKILFRFSATFVFVEKIGPPLKPPSGLIC